MSKEIRWLYEAKSPQEKVNDEENNVASTIAADYLKYTESKGILERDNAIADALDKVVGNQAGEKLKKGLGVGWLTRFMKAFKWDSLQKDNLFIRMLERIFGGYNDSKLVSQILSGQRPTASRDIDSKVGKSEVNTQLSDTAQAEVSNESLNEKTIVPVKRRVNTTKSGANKNSGNSPIIDKNAKITATTYYADADDAKILDMSPTDLFMVLYNGYLNHLYTYEDIINVNNDTKDASTIRGRDGNNYTIGKSLLDIINKCQNNDNAFTTKESENKISRKSTDYRNVDLKDDILDKFKTLRPTEKKDVIYNLRKIAGV